jgi:Ca-activated chloride channel family protein
MRLAIQQMNPNDTFNLLSFSGGTGRCFPKPVPNTPKNRAIALKYLADLYGSGGTQMMPAILEALGGDHDPERVRIVAFMTDGYIGNDFAIIDAVRKHAGTSRVFAFGIGNAVNRFLLDGMAQAGRGAVEYVTLQSQGEGAAKRFHDRIHTPVLTDIVVDWGNLPVTEVYPKQIPDLFSNKPILIHGRLTGPADGTLVLRGNTAGGPFARRIRMRPSAPVEQHDALASLWARAKVKDLMMQDYAAVQRGDAPEQMRHEITALGVEFRLMTQFTSFVAVEEMTVTVAGKLVTIAVPVEMPAGVSYEGVFGQKAAATLPSAPPSAHGFSGALTLQRQASPSATMPRAEELSADRGYREDEAKQRLSKLAASLRRLAEQVAREGNNGTLTVDNLRVLDYRVDVMVYLRDTSDATLEALQELGLVKTGESKTIRLVIGSIDVRQLEKLAQLETVLRVMPVSG